MPIYHSFNLTDDEFDFKVVQNEVVLADRETGKSFTLGAVVEHSVNEYGVAFYKIKIKQGDQAVYRTARGFFPYYQAGTFTMMSSGGLKYSHEIKTVITSKGEQLILYFSNGYISTGEKSRITDS